jgi:membrane protein implicated in regulation of membrane protease activity
VLVVLATSVCALVASLTLRGSGGTTIIVSVLATMLVAVVVSIAGGDQDDQETSRQKPDKDCFHNAAQVLSLRCVTILPQRPQLVLKGRHTIREP